MTTQRPPIPSANISIAQAAKFYRTNNSGATSDDVVKDFLRHRKTIVFGARAVNQRLPSHLDKHTEDWDILTPKDPEKIANKIEAALDERYDANFFVVQPALHPGTFKVKSVVTGKTIADISGLTEVVPHTRIRGINYATLDHQVKNIRRSLADEGSRFRHAKDRESLQRINVFRVSQGKPVFKEKPTPTKRTAMARRRSV